MARGNKFGTFGGVFTPSILTILGVILYMRLPRIVGQGGFWLALGIIIVAHVISITTGLSVSSIATDKRVKTGGPYYIVSRSLGLPLGGTLGLALFAGLAFSVSLYVIGFCESFLAWRGIELSLDNIRLYGSITLAIVTAVTLISTAFAIKAQYVILVCIAGSLVSIFFGSTPAPAEHAHLQPVAGGVSAGVLFGIFFPAVTGFTAGVNMSGDLADPRRSIPLGTLSAIVVGFAVYVGLALFFALRVPADQLADPDILLKISLAPSLVYAGIWGATISSALGAILGAPRILQALSLDRITPRIFAKGHGKTNEPRNALILAFIIAEAGILIGELDLIARIVSMFFIMTYGFLNLSCAIESWASPDFRPEFRIPRFVSVLGAVTCVLIMIQLDILAMAGATLVLGGIFFWLTRRELALASGDTWTGVWSSVVRLGLQRLDRDQQHERQWRPNIILFDRPAAPNRPLTDFGRSLVATRGVLTEFQVGDEIEATDELAEDTAPAGVFRQRAGSADLDATVDAVSRFHGFSGMQPNTLLLDWAAHTAPPARFAQVMAAASVRDFNVLLLAHDPERRFGDRERIDIWWTPGRGSVPLSLALVRFLSSSDAWHRARIRFLILTQDTALSDTFYQTMSRLLDEARMDATVKVINNSLGGRPLEEWVAQESSDADLTAVGLPSELDGDAEGAVERLSTLAAAMGTVLFIRPSTSFDEVMPTSGRRRPRRPVRPEAEGDDAPLDLRPVTLPDLPPLAAEVWRVAERLEDTFAELHERFLVPFYRQHDHLNDEVAGLIKRSFGQLEKGLPDASPTRRRKLVARVQSSFLFQAGRQLTTFKDEGLRDQRATLAHGVGWFLQECDALTRAAPAQLPVLRDPEAFLAHPGDPTHLAAFKWRTRTVAQLRKAPPQYELPFGGLVRWYVSFRGRELLYEALSRLGADAYETATEVTRLLQAAKTSLTVVSTRHSDQGFGADSLGAEKSRILERLVALSVRNQSRIRDHREELLAGVRALVQELADDTGRLDALRHLRRERRLPRRAGDLRVRLTELHEVWASNQSLFMDRSELAIRVAALQHRLWTIVQRTKTGLSQELQRGLLRGYEDLLERLRRFANDVEADRRSALDAPTDLEPLDEATVVERLSNELGMLTAELPETFQTIAADALGALDDDPFEDLEVTQVAVRRLVQFLIDSEFVGALQESLTAVAGRQQRAVVVAQDVVRLVGFNVTDFEFTAGDGEDGAYRAHLMPVVQDGIGRLEAELDVLREQPGELIDRIDTQLYVILHATDAFAITGSVDSLKRYVRGGEGQRVLSSFGTASRQVGQVLRDALVALWYRRSSGLLLARRLAQVEDRELTLTDRILARVVDSTPRAEVLSQLPFYYQQLFLGRSAINEAFWVGRDSELGEADRAVRNYRRGYRGALFVTGPRNYGKTSLCQHVAKRSFTEGSVFEVFPPAGGTTDVSIFQQAVQRSVQIQGDWSDIFETMPEQSVMIIHGLEMWWGRHPDGMTVIDLIGSLIDRYSDRCFFIVSASDVSFNLMNRIGGVAAKALAVVRCAPIDAEALKDIISRRHASTGLRYQLNGRGEQELSDWTRARLFTDYFTYSRGSVGTALQAWIAHIERVDGETLVIRRPRWSSMDILHELRTDWIALLIQLALHSQLTVERLLRITGADPDELRADLNALIRMGLVTETLQHVVELNRFVRHGVIEHLVERRLLR